MIGRSISWEPKRHQSQLNNVRTIRLQRSWALQFQLPSLSELRREWRSSPVHQRKPDIERYDSRFVLASSRCGYGSVCCNSLDKRSDPLPVDDLTESVVMRLVPWCVPLAGYAGPTRQFQATNSMYQQDKGAVRRHGSRRIPAKARSDQRGSPRKIEVAHQEQFQPATVMVFETQSRDSPSSRRNSQNREN